MNHLAHFYLAGEDPNLSIGNYIADQVKGKQKDKFSLEISRGIDMHRQIDHYTDTHSLVKENVIHLKPILGRYSSIALDVIYDYFLANHWEQYSKVDLQKYCDNRYQLLENNYNILPVNSQHFYHYMTRNNILFNYQFQDHLERVFYGMSTRTKFKSELHKGVEALRANHKVLEDNFQQFFADLKSEFANW